MLWVFVRHRESAYGSLFVSRGSEGLLWQTAESVVCCIPCIFALLMVRDGKPRFSVSHAYR